ncbi:MAG: NAD(P)H-binding protein [Desulfatibacillaceae bacterium]
MSRILVTGATGFLGKRLVHALDDKGHGLRCLSRSAKSLDTATPLSSPPEMVRADLLEPETLPAALDGVDTAYYLVHSMGGSSMAQTREFENRDRLAAENFVNAADRAGVRRIIYMGGLGDLTDDLSPHLRSRQEIGDILQSGRVRTTVLRAAVIIGAGGASFEIIRYLVWNGCR